MEEMIEGIEGSAEFHGDDLLVNNTRCVAFAFSIFRCFRWKYSDFYVSYIVTC
jgi:hypothetical protein